jgi:tetratricopeptide (TPR) repeat protein
VDGVVAQLVERLVRNEKVRSSSLLGSTKVQSSSFSQTVSSQNLRFAFYFGWLTFLQEQVQGRAMPTTYNGIGTHYYGKKNVDDRQGVCQFCRCQVKLSSYDTRLWFVIIFIPVIPLGKKRIIDYCSSCTRHYMMELDKWEAAKQLEVSGAMERFRSTPTPEVAIEAHQQLLKFHQYGPAETFRQTMREKFSDNAKVHLHLALCLEHLGQMREAEQAFARALELRPDMPEAKVGVAEGHIRAGRLVEARKLLAFLENPGSEQLYSLGPLEDLANAHQAAGSHREALELFQILLRALPKVAEHDGFRKRVKASEKALGNKESILPKGKFNWRKFFQPQSGATPEGSGVTWRGLAIFAGIVALLLIGALGANEHTRQNRTLHVVSALPADITVQIDDLPPLTVRNGVRELVIPEGKHRARITGAVNEELDFELKAKYFDRWFSDPVWVLNPGRSAVLVFETAIYSQNPPPSTFSFHFGETLHWFPDVSHPFKPLPDSLHMKSSETRTLTQVDVLRVSPASLFGHLISQRKQAEALKLAEIRLRYWPDDGEMLGDYVDLCREQKQKERMEKFLAQGLEYRPVVINWHRQYQNLDDSPARERELVKVYDGMLAKEPGNSALLYLRGRLATDRQETRKWFERAREADGKNPYPLYALGYEYVSRGDWQLARPLYAKAVELDPKNEDFKRVFFECRMAEGEYAELEAESRKQMSSSQPDYRVVHSLLEVLSAQGRRSEAEQVLADFVKLVQPKSPEAAVSLNAALSQFLLYAQADFAGLEKLAAENKAVVGKNAAFYALMEQGKLAEAVKLHPLDEPEVDALHLMTVSLAWQHAGDLAEASRWRARAVEILKSGGHDDQATAEVLESKVPPQLETVKELVMPASGKAILLAVLGTLHPNAKAEYFTLARRLNVTRTYPYHLVARTVAGPQ